MKAILEVTNDEGEIVLELPFAEALLDAPDKSPTTTLIAYRSGAIDLDRNAATLATDL